MTQLNTTQEEAAARLLSELTVSMGRLELTTSP
jgi:hypothetical protein